jgi:hypothetical protein
VLVSAQQSDQNDSPVVYAATVTEDDGSYALFLDPDRDGDGIDDLYTIVAYRKGYDAGCTEVITSSEMNQAPGTTGVTLVGPKATGTLTEYVAISVGSADQYVTLSFRQVKNCTSAVSPPDTQPVYIEVTTGNYVNNDYYSAELTVGTYDVNASTYDAENDQLLEYEAGPVGIAEGGSTPHSLDISF